MLASHLAEIESAFHVHRAPLERYLTGLIRDPDAAQDIVQEAFLRLAREVQSGRSPGNVGAWLHRVATNLARSRGRHLQVVDRRAGQLQPPALPDAPEQETIRAELHSTVAQLLAGLSSAEREALVLAAQGFNRSEIATRVGRTPGATRTLLCRSRAKLRQRLAQSGLAFV
jgi:RNA polymerase sigma-70 factor (ECF subfamily)